MSTYLEAWTPAGAKLVPLDGDRLTVGSDASNDVAVEADGQMSGLHAVLERYAAGWAIRDLGSSNGTFVNGERVWAERRLRDGDEIRLGRTRFVFSTDVKGRSRTEAPEAVPDLTPRERDVLNLLCRPLMSGDVFTEPATVQDIAGALVVSEAAVKQHLTNLYAKFDIGEGGTRRVRLANEAVRRGAVHPSTLRPDADQA